MTSDPAMGERATNSRVKLTGLVQSSIIPISFCLASNRNSVLLNCKDWYSPRMMARYSTVSWLSFWRKTLLHLSSIGRCASLTFRRNCTNRLTWFNGMASVESKTNSAFCINRSRKSCEITPDMLIIKTDKTLKAFKRIYAYSSR